MKVAGPARPNDILHRYVLRPGAARKVRHRLNYARRHGTRDAFGDIRRLLPVPPRVVFDVGANIGYVANDFHKAWPAARLYCFEPTEQTYGRLVTNMGAEAGVRCLNLAVSDADGTATFLVDNRTHGGGSNSLKEHTAEFDLRAEGNRFEKVEVPCTRLDTFCEAEAIDHIDVLKLDIEGAEPMALRGAGQLLASSAIDVIMTEVRLVPSYADDLLLHDVIAQLAEDDYQPYGVYRFAESKIGQSLFGDAVFLGPRFRRTLIDRHGPEACGFLR